jgi:hypothetical protein
LNSNRRIGSFSVIADWGIQIAKISKKLRIL